MRDLLSLTFFTGDWVAPVSGSQCGRAEFSPDVNIVNDCQVDYNSERWVASAGLLSTSSPGSPPHHQLLFLPAEWHYHHTLLYHQSNSTPRHKSLHIPSNTILMPLLTDCKPTIEVGLHSELESTWTCYNWSQSVRLLFPSLNLMLSTPVKTCRL